LIEMLVVIAILAILAALLVPVGRQAVTAANRMKSASQMKQIGQALHGTAADLNGFLPSISGMRFGAGRGLEPLKVTWIH